MHKHRIPLTSTVTDEQLLDFVLSVAAEDIENVPFVAERIIIVYAINELGHNGKGFTEDDIVQKYKELIADYILTNLTKKGLLEVDFSDDELMYRLTEEGRKYVRKID